MYIWMSNNANEAREEKKQSLYDALYAGNTNKFQEICGFFKDRAELAEAVENFIDSNKRTLLHLGVMHRSLSTLYFLKSAPINAQDDRGYTALHYAVMMRDDSRAVKWLFRQGININIQSKQGYTAYDIVEGLWQEECNRLFRQKKTRNTSFVKLFQEKIGLLFNPTISDHETRVFLREYPAIKAFLKQNEILSTLTDRKQRLERMQCQRQNKVDFETFVEPYFLCFDEPVWEESYWYEIPSVSSTYKPKESHEGEISVLKKEYPIWKESTLGLSELYKELEIAVDKTQEQMGNIIANNSTALHLAESGATTEKLNAESSRLSQVSRSTDRFFLDQVIDEDEEDKSSEYSLVY